jgi:hypothetical protein
MRINYPVETVEGEIHQLADTGFAPLHVIDEELGSSDSSV